MRAVELHRHAVHRGELLQPLRGDAARILVATVRVQHRHPAPVRVLEFVQATTRFETEQAVEVEKIGLARHVVLPLECRKPGHVPRTIRAPAAVRNYTCWTPRPRRTLAASC